MRRRFLIITLLGVAFISFCQLNGGIVVLPVCLCLPLPLFIWAAVRFGFAASAQPYWASQYLQPGFDVHERGPFTSGSAQENALSIQTFFTLLSVILVPMAAVFLEKKGHPEALHASEQRYRMVVETQSDLLCRCFVDTTLTFVNDSWCHFLRGLANN